KTRGDRKAALLRVIPGAAVVLHLILPPAHDHQRLANILRGDRNFGSADDVDGVPPAAAEFDDPAAVIEALSEQLADAESGAGPQGGSRTAAEIKSRLDQLKRAKRAAGAKARKGRLQQQQQQLQQRAIQREIGQEYARLHDEFKRAERARLIN